jgi:dienelactone hydrolase
MHYTAEGRSTRLICFDVRTQAATFIGLRDASMVGDDVLFLDPQGEYLLLSVTRTLFNPPSIYRIALKDNDSKQLIRPMDNVYQWYADEKGTVRAGFGRTRDGWFVTYRKGPDDAFREIAKGRYNLMESPLIGRLTFVSGSDEGYILAKDQRGLIAAYKYDFGAQKIGELLFAAPSNDVESLDFDPLTNKLQGIRFTDDRPRVVWMDPLLKEVQEGIDRAMPGKFNQILSRSEDNSLMLVHSGSTQDPGTYFVFDLVGTKMLRLAKANEELKPAELARMEAVTYQARDGLSIPAYLTLPVGRDPKNLPLVIMPHGGPYGVRDTLRFDNEVQFLANRGYAVLQPNYRGSDSYGEEYYKRGYGEWGRKMQDDLDDGMDWLVKRGLVDAKRVALVGGSYGGYAAAWGVTRNPERYRCAVCFAGVFNLRTQLGYTSDFLMSRIYRQYKLQMRGPETFDLDSVSPRLEVKRLQVPVLLIHGEEDNIVPISESRSYAAALQKAGKTHEFHAIPKEIHGFKEKSSLAFYLGKVEAFLARHNPA